ncbi:hypothetical protein CHS0354_023782 [Potamilus streckersoni]|uniref:Uncharacterized protein n=1 Tax=Potamilus streckersoni TaxID=2493646 RepID=A0AAE0RZ47_9BIVA|nr:hypothetical protein CHS0354_023782 [Potamilus streckersoni]
MNNIQNKDLPTRLVLKVIDKDGFRLPDTPIFLDSSVLDPPDVASFNLKIIPPSYSNIPISVLDENFGDITALEGSQINIQLTTTKPFSSANLYFLSDSSYLKLNNENGTAVGTFKISKNDSYQFKLLDKNQLENKHGATYQIKVIPDLFPNLNVVRPSAAENELSESLKEPLQIEIEDDLGFSSFTLYYQINSSLYFQIDTSFKSIPLPLNGSTNEVTRSLIRTIFYEWNLASEQVVAGDEVKFYFEIADNDAIHGFKKFKSNYFKYKAPTLEELYKSVESKEKDIANQLNKQIYETEMMSKEIERIQNELKQKSKIDWQDKKAIENLIEKQKSIQSKLEETVGSIDETIKRMESRNLLSKETLEKYMEVQELLKNSQIPELQDEMKKLQEKLTSVKENEVREALKSMEFNEDRFKKRLERIKELLLRTQLEKKYDELSKRLSELSAQQNKLTQKINSDNEPKLDPERRKADLINEQAAIQKQLEAFEKAFSNIKEKLSDFQKSDKLPNEEIKQFEEKYSKENPSDDINQVKQSIEKNNLQTASQKSQSASKKLSSLSDALNEIKSSFKKMQKSEIIDALRQAVQNALSISKAQEEIRDNLALEMKDNKLNKSEAQDFAVEQADISELLESLTKDMQKASKRMPTLPSQVNSSLSQAKKEMQGAIDQLDKMNPSESLQKMGNAMSRTNEFADLANDVLEALLSQNGEGGGGEFDLDDISENQKNLNNKTASELDNFLNNTSDMNQRLQGKQGDRMKQLAAQQRMIQQQLQQYKQSQLSKGNQNTVEQMEKIAEDMETTAQGIERDKGEREIVKRQKEILSRLLNASRSLKKQEQDERRESEAPKQTQLLSSPKEMMIQQRSKLQQIMSRIKEYGYSESYEKLIRSYYRILEQKSKETLR